MRAIKIVHFQILSKISAKAKFKLIMKKSLLKQKKVLRTF